jgi:hypothetical protein
LNTARRLTLDTAVFDNYGNFVLVDAAQVRRSLNLPPPTLFNRASGTIKKTEANGAEIRCQVTSQGAVVVQGGDLTFYSSGTYSGPFTVNAATSLTLSNTNAANASIHNFQAGSSFSGTGQVVLTGTDVTMSIAGGHTLRMDKLRVTDGTLIEINGGTISARIFEWNMGKIKDSAVSVLPGDVLTIGAEADCTLDNTPIMDGGTIDWTANNIDMQNGSEINISDKMNISSSGNITSGNDPMAPDIVAINPGGFLLKVAGDMNTIDPAVSNISGTMDLGGMALWLSQGYLSTDGQTYVRATGYLGIGVDGHYEQWGESAIVELLGGIFYTATSCEIHSGEFRLGGGTVGGNFNLLGGLLSGHGAINGDVLNSSRIRIFSDGATGTLDIHGSYTQSSSGTLEIHANEGTCDRILADEDVILNGTVEVSLEGGYSPPPGTAALTMMLYGGARTGTFATILPNTWIADYSQIGSVVLRN